MNSSGGLTLSSDTVKILDGYGGQTVKAPSTPSGSSWFCAGFTCGSEEEKVLRCSFKVCPAGGSVISGGSMWEYAVGFAIRIV